MQKRRTIEPEYTIWSVTPTGVYQDLVNYCGEDKARKIWNKIENKELLYDDYAKGLQTMLGQIDLSDSTNEVLKNVLKEHGADLVDTC